MALPTPTLTTARLRARSVDDRDVDDLLALHADAYVLRYWDAPPWTERSRATAFVERSRRLAEKGTGARWVVERLADGGFLGWCGLTRLDADHHSAALGYCFRADAWGHGYATEAAQAVVHWAFGTLDLNRVQAETDTRNLASARVLEKVGFVREGTQREDCVVAGEVSDSWVYGLIARDRAGTAGVDPPPVSSRAAVILRDVHGPRDVEALQAVLEAAPRYARAVTGAPATAANAAEVVAGLPAGLDAADKHVWLLQAQGRRIGAVDLLDGYPHVGAAWVGLLVLDEAHQGCGLGRRAWAAVERRVRSWGHVHEVRLAVVRTNESVLPFWRRCGFTETGETHPYRHGPVVSESLVLRKPLRG